MIGRGRLALVIFGWAVFLMLPIQAVAQTSTSANYKVEESTFDFGGNTQTTSGSFQARSSGGSLGVGQGDSANFRGYPGYITPTDEYVEMYVPTATVDMGTLTSSTTATGSISFYARTYMNSGYTIQTMSPPPTSEAGAILNPITSAAASSAGTEQFGMNLVANTAPAVLGAAPDRIPNNTFAFGQARAGYDTANLYQYNQGDIVAESLYGWGQTTYTISYIMNVSGITEAGLYSMNHDLVIVPSF